MRKPVLVRTAAVAGAAIAFVVLAAGPASAHSISGPRPTNYRSRVVSITPAIPGLSARTVDLGSRLELTNRTGTEVTVLGYEGEPYLRVGPEGVFENLNSQATYLNRTRNGGDVPPDVDTSPDAKPEWKKVSGGSSVRWHDHRIHWMGSGLPPLVAASPGSFHHLTQQNIILRRGGERVVVAVSLDWVPGPSGVPWVPVLVALFAVGVLGALWRWRWRTLAALVGVLVVLDAAHAIGFEIARPGSNGGKLVQFFGESFVSVAVWIAAAPTVIALVRRRAEALYGVVFVGVMVALIGGLADLSSLWKSQVPDAGPAWLTRVEVVGALGLGSGVVVGALVHMLRSRAGARAEEPRQWLSLLVSGLSDVELARITDELDADDVLEVAYRELAARAAPASDAFAGRSLVLAVDDRVEPVEWSLTRDDAVFAVRATRGRVEPVGAEIRTSFAVMLQLLAGTITLDEANARALSRTTGDAALVERVAPCLAEIAPVTRPTEGARSAP